MAELTITEASCTHTPGEGYVGRVVFQISGHAAPYEMTLFSQKGREWEYNLLFAGEPGRENDISQAEEMIETNDDWFDQLVDAAWDTLEQTQA